MTEFDVTHYCHEDKLIRVNQINDPEILFHDTSDVRDLSLLKSFQIYSCDHARGILSVTTTAAASRFEESDGAPSAPPRDIDEAASVDQVVERRRLQALQNLQNAGDVVKVEASLLVWCVR